MIIWIWIYLEKKSLSIPLVVASNQTKKNEMKKDQFLFNVSVFYTHVILVMAGNCLKKLHKNR